MPVQLQVVLRRLHPQQLRIKNSPAKRKIIRAGRRGGKTTLAADIAVDAFLAGRRVLYGTPTTEQIDRFWQEVNRALKEPIDHKVYYRNQTKHIIELRGMEQRIRAKTAWNADTLRGDYADLLILDEFQAMNEETWDVVGAPMLIDNDGDAVFIYTPPSLHSRSANKANDPQHAAKLFKKHLKDTDGRWECFHFTSHENPYISATAIGELAKDMTALAIRQEINAEDVDEAPGALWHRTRTLLPDGKTFVCGIEDTRVTSTPELVRIVVGLDPSATTAGDEAGIVAAGATLAVDVTKPPHYYTLEDVSIQGSPLTWAKAAVALYHKLKADVIVVEDNNGGEMCELTILQVDPTVHVKRVHATRGKATRAEPIAAIAEQGRDHHVGYHPALEDELCLWVPGDPSPNRLDAKVWAYTELVNGVVNWEDDQDELTHVSNYKPLGA